MNTKRQMLVDAIEARMKEIVAGNGYTLNGRTLTYTTNLGTNVFIWHTGTFSDEELESMPDGALILRDIDEVKSVEGDHTKFVKTGREPVMRELHMQIEVIVSGTDAPVKFRKAVADIETAIRKDVRWKDADGKPLAIGTRPRIDRSVVEQQSRKMGGDIYEFFVHYGTEAFNAYQ